MNLARIKRKKIPVSINGRGNVLPPLEGSAEREKSAPIAVQENPLANKTMLSS
jgi:hypothetical protein